MRATFWGVRGSFATAQAAMLGVGGNTPCVAVELPDVHLVLDAGTGICALGQSLAAADRKPIHVLLTHFHLDHIQGLLFFAPLFQRGREVVIWAPHARRHSPRAQLAHYLSPPLSPVEIAELRASVSFRECRAGAWQIGGAQLRAAPILHRGLTLGFRVEHGGGSLAYLPDHEPALSARLDRAPSRWLSGADLAKDADVLIHDAQYDQDRYRLTRGWGHSTVADAVRFADLVGAADLRLFHHDPSHDDATLAHFEGDGRDLARHASVRLAREGEVVCAD
jgi:phosphoribosyl 1,2-cyclic phosphodiesterase